MACSGFRQPFQGLLRLPRVNDDIPIFLAPSISRTVSRKQFSTSTSRSSRIGQTPISIPPEVNLKFYDLPKVNALNRHVDSPTTAVDVTGPQGSLTVKFPPYVFTKYDEADRKVTVSVGDPNIKHQKSMWGTMRSHMHSSVAGVSEGHICVLKLVGVGYRATIEESAITKKPAYPGQKFVSMKLGFAHPVELGIPQHVKASAPQPTRILLEGPDKQTITQFAAELRAWRKPEPYKGKGIFVNNETIKLKAKKIK